MKKALYRELRPITFAEVIDKDIIVSVLKNQIKTSSVSHGYLFCGTRGTGKTSVAKIFSRAVNCLNPVDGEPCNQCKNCREILEDRSVDVLELDAASNNGVDNIRELKNMGVYPPSNLKKKVYIIDEAHMLSNSAFNALLKILEEPPEHLIFILATTDPDKLPDTVKSRLQRFDFHTISKKEIEKAVKRAAEKLGEDIEDSVFRLIANESRGSMRDALSALDQLLSLPERPISERLAVELLGVTGIYELMPLVKAILSFDYKATLDATDELEAMGRSPEKLIYSLMEVFRDIYLLKLDPGFDVVNREEYANILDCVEIPTIVNILERLRLLLNDISNAFDRALVFQIGVLGIIKDEYIKRGNFKIPATTKPEVQRPLPTSEEKKTTMVKSQPENLDPETKLEKSEEQLRSAEPQAEGKEPEKELLGQEEGHQNIEKQAEPEPAKELEEASEDLPPEIEEAETSIEEGDQGQPSGQEIYERLVQKFPLLVDIDDAYTIRLDGDRLVFRLKDPAVNDGRVDMFKEDIENLMKEVFNKEVKIVKENQDPDIERAKEIFGDLLKIK